MDGMVTHTKNGHDELMDAITGFRQLLTIDQNSELTVNPQLPAIDIVELTQKMEAKKPKSSRRVQRFLESTQQFIAIVDTFIQSDPRLSALVWGSVKLAILAALNYHEYFEKLTEMLQKLGDLCPILKRLQEVFPESTELQSLVYSFYATIVRFCTKALKIFNDNGFKQFGKTLWKPFKLYFKDIENELLDRRDNIELEIKIASEAAAIHARQEASLYRLEGRHHRDFQIKAYEESCDWRIQHDGREQQKRRQSLLSYITDYNYKATFSKALRRRHPGTGKWILKTPEFNQWKSGKRSCGLWCHGIPGSGKTILAAGIVDSIFSEFRGQSISMCYFFCDFANPRSLEICTVLRCLIRQILNVFIDRITARLEAALEDAFLDSIREPSPDELFKILLSVIDLSETTYIIIDGLDECSDWDRLRLLNYLKLLTTCRHKRVRLWCSTRYDSDIAEYLPDCQHVSLDSSYISSDIEAYIAQELAERVRLKCLVIGEPTMLQEIQSALVQGSDGMFLWVAFQVDEICRENNDGSIRIVLQSLPRGLNATFERILQRIVDTRKPDIASRIFTWMAGVKRPLSLQEVHEAIAVEAGDQQWQQANNRILTDRLRMIQNCGNLVTLVETEEKDDFIVQFAHHTVLEFFLSDHLRSAKLGRLFSLELSKANHYIARACLTYLMFNDFGTEIATATNGSEIDIAQILPNSGIHQVWIAIATRIWGNPRIRNVDLRRLQTSTYASEPAETATVDLLVERFRLLRYVVDYWLDHCASLYDDGCNDLCRIFSRLALEQTLCFSHTPWKSSPQDHEAGILYPEQFKWAVRNNHDALLKAIYERCPGKLQQMRKYLKLVNKNPNTNFFFGCSKGDTTIVHMFLYFGTDPNTGFGLHPAAGAGHLSVVDQLLKAGANVELRGSSVGATNTPLQAAAAGGHLAVVDRLLRAGADVNAPASPRGGRTALQAASEDGNLAIVNRLLASGANISAPPAARGGKMALFAAASMGHLPVVDRLLAAAAPDNRFVRPPRIPLGVTSSLSTAAKHGHLAIVERFLQLREVGELPALRSTQASAARTDRYRSALILAARNGHYSIVDRLIVAGADVNVVLRRVTALLAAAQAGHIATVERLLAAGADMTATYADGRNAYEAAKLAGHEAIAKRLQEAGSPTERTTMPSGLSYSAEDTYIITLRRKGQSWEENDHLSADVAGDAYSIELERGR